MRRHTTISMTGASLLIIGGALLYAGPLDPPDGPITSTYKTLTEVEPRTAINEVNTPGDAGNVYVVSRPGSYYLTGDVAGAPGKNGIGIGASNVTIDLNGFTMEGVPGSGHGVQLLDSYGYVTIRNGRVRGWSGDGIRLWDGGFNFIVERVEVAFNAGTGIYCNSNAVVRACVATSNTSEGITCGTNAVVEHCESRGNGSNGIKVFDGSVVRSCVVRANSYIGIFANDGCTVSDSLVMTSALQGIYSASAHRCTVERCKVDGNGGSGIEIGRDSLVVGNSVWANGNEGTEAGILITGSDCRVESNNVTDSFCGIRADGTGSLIIRNSASGNTTADYNIASGNFCGTIVTSEAAMNSAANANVNISY